MKKTAVLLLGTVISFVIAELIIDLYGLFFRPESRSANDKGRPLIVCAGDSFTYGYGVEKGQDYPSILQKTLRKQSKFENSSVINLGTVGANSHQIMKQIETLLKETVPDYIVFQGGGQNHHNLYGLDSGYGIVEKSGLKKLLLSLHHKIADISAVKKDTDRISELSVLKIPETEDYPVNTAEVHCSVDFSRYGSLFWEMLARGNVNEAFSHVRKKTSLNTEEAEIAKRQQDMEKMVSDKDRKNYQVTGWLLCC